MISKLLVANRGEIAARVMRTARALGIATVAVFSDPDADAPFVRDADEAVRLPGAAAAETYLRGDLVIAAARAAGADAVHPGYGFLSENVGFAQACADAGLVFVGPPPTAIAAMGSKLAAKELMEQAGVPVLPTATLREDGTDRDLRAAGEWIGFPALVKAAFGGGGRGMRVVHEPAELAEAVAAARREAASAFGDGTVFLERFVVDPRHIEMQIFGDAHGSVVHLFERECSIQRRYQKIVEECPSPAVDDTLRAELGAAAVAAGKAIGYVGAGTVEFVVDRDGTFSFLEVNTRLQVEHPVTELVTGLDLVELQLRVAEGDRLPAALTGAQISGHAIEARLYAEDVPAGFLPATGTLHRFRIPGAPGIRVDAGVADGSVVGPHYDPLLAKVIAHGPTRADACRRLARALAGAHLHGVTTNRDLLVGILSEPEFLAGRTDTGYLTRHDPAALSAPATDAAPLHAVAAAFAEQAANRATAPVLATLPSGWRSIVGTAQHVAYRCGERTLERSAAQRVPDVERSAAQRVPDVERSAAQRVPDVEVAYRFGRDGVDVRVNGEPLDVTLHAATPTSVDLEVRGVRRTVTVHRVGDSAYVDSALGSTALTVVPRFPDPAAAQHAGSLLAPMPGSVVRVLADPDTTVTAGQPLIVLEAMKMEHTITAPADGTLTELHVAPGDQVDTGQVLAVVDTTAAP